MSDLAQSIGSWAAPSWAWIALTLLAVVMQSVRTAGQKHLTSDLSPIGATLVRFIFGLPFAIIILVLVLKTTGLAIPELHTRFWMLVFVSGMTQIAATALLVHLFSLRNFAVGTTYVRTEAFLTAMIGAIFFGELITVMGWFAIVVSVVGVVLLTIARSDIEGASLFSKLWTPAAAIGLASGMCFAVCSLFLRTASLSLESDSWLLSASVTLVAMISLQTVILTVWVAMRDRTQLTAMRRRWPLCAFVGLTSALGSIGWFTAMTLERASYVKALGQIEFVFALAISILFFREKTNRLELLAMAFIAIGVLILVLLA